MINLFFIEEAAGREVRRFCFMGIVAFVSFRGCKWIIYPLYIANTAPRMLRDVARENNQLLVYQLALWLSLYGCFAPIFPPFSPLPRLKMFWS